MTQVGWGTAISSAETVEELLSEGQQIGTGLWLGTAVNDPLRRLLLLGFENRGEEERACKEEASAAVMIRHSNMWGCREGNGPSGVAIPGWSGSLRLILEWKLARRSESLLLAPSESPHSRRCHPTLVSLVLIGHPHDS